MPSRTLLALTGASLFIGGLVFGFAAGRLTAPSGRAGATANAKARTPLPRKELREWCRSRDMIDVTKRLGLPDRQVPAQGGDAWWVYDGLSVDEATGRTDASARLYVAYDAAANTRVCGDVQFDP